MSILLYKRLHKSTGSYEPTPRWVKACAAGVVAGFVGLVAFGINLENRDRWERNDKIAAPGTKHLGTTCTVNAVKHVGGARVVKLLMNHYETSSGEKLSQPKSIDLENFSKLDKSRAVGRVPFWSEQVGCPAGPTID